MSFKDDNEPESLENWFFLVAKPTEKLLLKKSFVLPFYDDVSVCKNLENILTELKPNTNICIGISSPKQNLLATKLHEIRPDIDFYCLGAALSTDYLLNFTKDDSKVSGSGFEWFKFLLLEPSRTIKKLKITITEILRITFDMKYRNQFKQFVKICSNFNSECS